MVNTRTEQYRKRNNIGEIASDDSILFYGYKEPLTKFEGGYGYKGVLSYSKDMKKIQCHLCGRLFTTLNGHIRAIHKLKASDYKEKTGLAKSTCLMSEEVREKFINRNRRPDDAECAKKARETLARKRAEGWRPKYKHSLELKNKKGSCPDQLLDLISKTAKSYGRTPTLEEFRKFHHGSYVGSIVKTYGSWTAAVEKLGMKTHETSNMTDEYLIEQIKNFYTVNKRTPRWSDFKRGLLPNVGIYYSRWQTLNKIRAVAGVPLVIHFGSNVEEYNPSEIERNKITNA